MIHVLVINNKDMFSGGVVSILGRECGFKITNKNITDKSALIGVLEELQPDTVVINESLFHTFPDTLLSWNKLFPKLRVIVLDENQNLIHVYEKKEVAIEHALDLVSIIRGNQVIPQ